MTILAEAFNRQLSEATIDAYLLGLDGLALEDIKRATQSALKQSKFMPAPSELRQMAGGTSLADRAQLAWLVVEQAIHKHHCYRTVSFDDVVINATIRSLGGWVNLCGTEVREFDTFTRQRFLAAYESLARSGVGAEQAAPLGGVFDSVNAIGGHGPQPVQIVATGLQPLPNAITPRIANDIPSVAGLLKQA